MITLYLRMSIYSKGMLRQVVTAYKKTAIVWIKDAVEERFGKNYKILSFTEISKKKFDYLNGTDKRKKIYK